MASTEFEGLEHLRDAAELLAVQDEKLKERLTIAGEEFWRAAYHYSQWPPEFQKQADAIVARILAAGPVRDTIPKMPLSEAQETAAEILHFMIEAEKFAAREAGDSNGNGNGNGHAS